MGGNAGIALKHGLSGICLSSSVAVEPDLSILCSDPYCHASFCGSIFDNWMALEVRQVIDHLALRTPSGIFQARLSKEFNPP